MTLQEKRDAFVDALEELRRLAEMHRGVPGANPLTPPIRQTLERLAAAWEKERAERESVPTLILLRQRTKELTALRSEVQRVEEEMRVHVNSEWAVPKSPNDPERLWVRVGHVETWADALRRARLGE